MCGVLGLPDYDKSVSRNKKSGEIINPDCSKKLQIENKLSFLLGI